MGIELIDKDSMSVIIYLLCSCSIRKLKLVFSPKNYPYFLKLISDRLIFLIEAKEKVKILVSRIPIQVHYVMIRIELVTENDQIPMIEDVKSSGKLLGFYKRFILIHQSHYSFDYLHSKILATEYKLRSEYITAFLKSENNISMVTFGLMMRSHPEFYNLILKKYNK